MKEKYLLRTSTIVNNVNVILRNERGLNIYNQQRFGYYLLNDKIEIMITNNNKVIYMSLQNNSIYAC